MSQYHVIMSDKNRREINASSASEAIFKALNRYRQLTVTECWLGGYEGPEFGQTGRTTFEIPPHVAMPPKPKPKTQDEEAEDESE